MQPEARKRDFSMRFDEFLTDVGQPVALVIELLEQATSGLFSWHVDSNKVTWSPQLFETLGYTKQEVATYESIQAITHPDDIDAMADALAVSQAKRSVYRARLRIQEKRGGFRFFDVRGVWRKSPAGADILLGFLVDVTESPSAKLRAERVDALFRAFFDAVPAAVFIKDSRYRHLYGNERAAELAGVSLAEFYEKRTDEIFDPKTSAALAASDDRVLLEKKTVVWTGPIDTARGDQRYIFETKFPIEDPESGGSMVGGFGFDITEQRETEMALDKARRLEAVGQLVAGVAHDFNNNLAVIGGNLELQAQTDDPAEAAAYRDDALAAQRKAAELTKQLLAFARKTPLQTETVSVNAVIQGMGTLLRRTVPESIDIETVAFAGLWQTELDVAQTESALLNLIINARDAMPHGGRLTVETSNVRISPEFVEDHAEELEPGPYVLVAVTDTGTGISDAVIDRVFEPFSNDRCDPSDTT